MGAKKTQVESEQPAKVYQLDAIESKVNGLAEQVTVGFTRVNSSIETLLVKSESQVTPQQLADNLAAQKVTMENLIREEVKKIHLEYRPMKNNVRWVLRAAGGQAIIIIGTVFVLVNFGGS